MFQIVDIFDALSSERPYKPAFSREKVIEIMEQEPAAGYWDPNLMSVFLKILRERPEALVRPEQHDQDRSVDVLADIRRSGVVEWYAKG